MVWLGCVESAFAPLRPLQRTIEDCRQMPWGMRGVKTLRSFPFVIGVQLELVKSPPAVSPCRSCDRP